MDRITNTEETIEFEDSAILLCHFMVPWYTVQVKKLLQVACRVVGRKNEMMTSLSADIPEIEDMDGGPGRLCKGDFTIWFRSRCHNADERMHKTRPCAIRMNIVLHPYLFVNLRKVNADDHDDI